ncbi:uncharacterized protein [Anoplolepis gracilipes]|uniref:uncharacterized protein n=1 Tax=Anoplolepis gracilipes TaxID=354296 RepID=UPI003B9E3E1D
MNPIKEYIDKKCEIILAAINSSKRSILYDVDNKVNNVKQVILSCNIGMPKNNIKELKESLDVVFPIKTFEDFLLLDEALANSEEKRKALMNFYRILLCGETCVKQCVKKIMTATLTQAVEIHYTAFGRQTHGKGKKDFSRTQVFVCLNDVLLEQFGRNDEYKKLSTALSRWLSGAADREGGRKKRMRYTEVPDAAQAAEAEDVEL